MVEFLFLNSEIFSTRPACPIAPAGVGYFVVGPGSSVVVAAVGGNSVDPGVSGGDVPALAK